MKALLIPADQTSPVEHIDVDHHHRAIAAQPELVTP